MKLIKKITALVPVFVLLSMFSAFAGNPVDSDLSNTAGTNSGNSHLDIYIFIVALLVLCVIIPYTGNKSKKTAGQ